MSKLIRSKLFMAKRGIKAFQFFHDYVQKGLQPYNTNTGEPIPPPDVSEKRKSLKGNQEEKRKLKLALRRFDLPPGGRKEVFGRFNKDKAAYPVELLGFWAEHSEAIESLENDNIRIKQRIETLKRELSSIKDNSWQDCSLPDSDAKRKAIYDVLENSLVDTEEIEKRFGLKIENTDEREFANDDFSAQVQEAKTELQEETSLDKEEFIPKGSEEQTVIELITKAKPEIELIYNAMKKNVGFSGDISNIETRLESEAVSTFTDNKDTFKLIKRKYLEDPEVYEMNPGQSKRDIVGRLVAKVVEEHTGKIIGAQKVYELYKKI